MEEELERVKRIISLVWYKNWSFYAQLESDRVMLQIKFMGTDAMTGERAIQSCRKWALSRHMTPSEIVGTAFKAVITAEEHEARERFTYKGRRIYNAHFNIEKLVTLFDDENIMDLRA
jgi:hypothetical protein